MKNAFRVAGAVQENTRDMFIRDVKTSGQRFPKRGCILEYEIFRFPEVILRDRCSTLYDPASLFRGRRSTFDRWSGKSQSALVHSTFHFWRMSRRIASFLMLSTSKIEGVSQNCFVFDVAKFKKWGSLTEMLHFLMLSSSKSWGSLAE